MDENVMITLNAIREALLSAEPWKRLDQLIRAEMASGQRTEQIYERLAELTPEVDDTPGLTEAGSDAFGDALDALTGMCHPNCQYRDEPTTLSKPTNAKPADPTPLARGA